MIHGAPSAAAPARRKATASSISVSLSGSVMRREVTSAAMPRMVAVSSSQQAIADAHHISLRQLQ